MPSDQNDTPVSAVMPAPPAAPPPDPDGNLPPPPPGRDIEADEKAPPVVGALIGLLSSQKALVVLAVTVGTLVLVGLGKVSWDQCKGFLQVLLPAWLGAHAVQDGLSAIGAGKEKS